MRMPNNKLPEVASNGFFIPQKYGDFIAVAPIKETAKTLYCCEVLTKTVKEEEDDGNYLNVTKVPDNVFRKGCQGSAYVYRVPKKEYPRERIVQLDIWR